MKLKLINLNHCCSGYLPILNPFLLLSFLFSLPSFAQNSTHSNSKASNENKKTELKGDPVRLIPATYSPSPNYWCTWSTQSYTVPGFSDNGIIPRSAKLDNLTEEKVFGKNGWAKGLYPPIKKDLFLLFDDGWEVTVDSSKTGNDRGLMGTMVLAADKFPSCKGTPWERLKKLNQLCIDAGWRGAAVVATQKRIEHNKGFYYPLADVSVEVGDFHHPVGIFGRYSSLSLSFNESLTTHKVYAQDLAGEIVLEITSALTVKGNTLIIPGA